MTPPPPLPPEDGQPQATSSLPAATPTSTAPPKNPTAPEECWDDDLRSLLRICNITSEGDLSTVFHTVVLISKDRAREAMEPACLLTAKGLRSRAPCIPYYVVVMVLALAFHTKYPEGVGDGVSIFLFPDLPPLVGS